MFVKGMEEDAIMHDVTPEYKDLTGLDFIMEEGIGDRETKDAFVGVTGEFGLLELVR